MNQEKRGLNISTRSFLSAIAVILVLMIVTYGLTFVVPGGAYQRIPDENGNLIIDTTSEFTNIEGGISFGKWLLSPILVLTAEGSGTLIAVMAFLVVIGGVFTALDDCGLMNYMLHRIVGKFGSKKYGLMAVIVLFFMAMGSLIGSFEEVVPLVPIVVALSVRLGWDSITGLGMSLLAAGCGFASGICNPFTVGVAQELAGLPMFSGVWLRLLSFLLIYALLFCFLRNHSRKVISEDHLTEGESFTPILQMDHGLAAFGGILGFGISLVLLSSVLPFLRDYTMIIVALMFLCAGVISSLVSGMSGKNLLRSFLQGMTSILPAIVMILMASSIKYTMTEAKILDTLLHEMVLAAGTMPKWIVVLFIYAVVLILNFFIASGSAKAFLLIPLIVPIARSFGISPQLCVLAFAFGDGFSNAFYPTNPVLLISLGLVDVSYGKWARWSGKFQLLNLLLTSGVLLFGLMIGY